MYDRIGEILDTRPVARCAGTSIGRSRGNRAIRAFRFGSGDRHISLLAGCHADEPVGPRLLRHLAGYLSLLPPDDPLLTSHQWWLLPHINPDGEERNKSWHRDTDAVYNLTDYLANVIRERPGDDIEFGFPRNEDDSGSRPENRSVYNWWRQADGPFTVHVSLHGMGFAAGPWFLIEEAWRDRCDVLKARCETRVRQLGHQLHDVERKGEKGFFRLGRGFCTRPDSRYMRQYFIEQSDPDTANLFRPSSMETIRSFGGDPLTLVTEMPLFITPGVGETLGPPDPVAQSWKERTEEWRMRLTDDGTDEAVLQEAAASGLKPMPVRDQMILQWTLIAAGIEQTEQVNRK
ncbi:MAG: peptidase [Gemmatimonadota bacterium]|nr:MAG: peptidase [Gemmatimonadota bacterium]